MAITMKVIFIILIGFILQKEQQSPDMEQYIIGEWEWIETKRNSRGGGSSKNPESCNCSKRLEITDENSIHLYEDEVLVKSVPYTIEKIQFMDDPIRFNFQSEIVRGTVMKLSDNKLGIGMFGGCGDIQYYIKKERKRSP